VYPSSAKLDHFLKKKIILIITPSLTCVRRGDTRLDSTPKIALPDCASLHVHLVNTGLKFLRCVLPFYVADTHSESLKACYVYCRYGTKAWTVDMKMVSYFVSVDFVTILNAPFFFQPASSL
jgi:hypothetical protein